MPRNFISRRAILISSSAAAVGLKLASQRTYAGMLLNQSKIDDFFFSKLESENVSGLAAGIIKNDEIIWSKGYGWANIKQKIAMSPVKTVQNIASVSKTITATALMQLWEQGKFQLDDDINEILPFEVKNPSYPKQFVTFRQLLTHRSSVKDGPAYGKSYACGDPTLSLENWLREYFIPGRKYYSRENFHSWKPGEQGVVPLHPRNYSNVGFGLLGYLVEILSKTDFDEYCRDNIFAPLEMNHTAWRLDDLEISKHAVPYQYVLSGNFENWLDGQDCVAEGETHFGGYCPYCLYSFPNYPDGLMRTSVNQLCSFLIAYANGGAFGKQRILQERTVRNILRPQVDSATHQGLGWASMQLNNGDQVWGHYGNDPGVAAGMFFRPADRTGVIVFANTSGVSLEGTVNRLFDESTKS